MALINLRLGFVFLANPHTASRATIAALKQLSNSREVVHHHATLETVYEHHPEARECDRVFQIVRHPFDWLVSRYFNTGGQRDSWRPWLKNCKSPIFGRFDGATHHGKYESLEEDLTCLAGEPVTLDWVKEHKTAGKPDWRKYWTDPTLIQWARNKWASDFERFDYNGITS